MAENDRREGRVIRVRADYARMYALIDYLTDNCCGGVSCRPAARKPARSKAIPGPRDTRSAGARATLKIR